MKVNIKVWLISCGLITNPSKSDLIEFEEYSWQHNRPHDVTTLNAIRREKKVFCTFPHTLIQIVIVMKTKMKYENSLCAFDLFETLQILTTSILQQVSSLYEQFTIKKSFIYDSIFNDVYKNNFKQNLFVSIYNIKLGYYLFSDKWTEHQELWWIVL